MYDDSAVSDHCAHARLLAAIQDGVAGLGRKLADVTVDDLAAVDEFHVGGRAATEHLLQQLHFTQADHVLDIGCGLGGAARLASSTCKCRVTGIDLTEEYVETGKVLSTWVGLADRVDLICSSALRLPFDDESFDGAYMLHVGMNVADKNGLFGEVSRVLRSGSCFGVYDLMRQDEGDLAYPVPWAKDERTSSLETPEQYGLALTGAGFEVLSATNRRDCAMEFFRQQRARMQAAGGPPPLGLHVLMQSSAAERLRNLRANITDGRIAPVEIVAKRS